MKKYIYEKKKVHNGIGLLPNSLVKFFFFFCIATLQLYCKREDWKKKICIAREGCSWTNCIASQGIVLQLGVQVGQELYCNTCIVLQLRRA